MKLGKNNKQIIDIAHRIIDRCDKDIKDITIKDDTITISLYDERVITMANLYQEYYYEEIFYPKHQVHFITENKLNYCPSVNTIWEINANGNSDGKDRKINDCSR